MKLFGLLLVIAASLCAQNPVTGEFSPMTVVARIDGHDITAGELQQLMRTWPPETVQQFQQDPMKTLQRFYTVKFLAAEAEKLQLQEDGIWKEQIAAATAQILATARATYEHDHYPVSDDDIKAFYDKNKNRYEVSRIKVIKLGLTEPISGGTSMEAVKQAAQIAVQNQHLLHPRTEAQARDLAAEILKKLKSGTDFATLAQTYSEDEDSKVKGGDFGEVTPTSSHPAEIKTAVFALQPGETSQPVRQPNSLYIIQVVERTSPPLDKLRPDIITEIRNQHLQVFGSSLNTRFKPTIVKPEFFLPSGNPPKK